MLEVASNYECGWRQWGLEGTLEEVADLVMIGMMYTVMETGTVDPHLSI